LISGLLTSLPVLHAAETAHFPAWKAGAAAVDITPEGSVWMAGYASRKRPSEGIAQHLYAKALALEDDAGVRMVMVTMDFVTVPRLLREEVERLAFDRFGLPREALLLNASHTHSGPSPTQPAADGTPDPIKGGTYGQFLRDQIIKVIGEALERRAPATLYYTHARAGFAMNRRRMIGNEVKNSPNPDGPVDHDVPVLRVVGADGRLKALVFGYACHNTVTGFYKINGDYAGYAQQYLEQKFPGTVALFMMGAGGDQNPYPRFLSLEQTELHGRTLAGAVEAALMVTPQRTIHGPLRSGLGYVELAYAGISRMELELRARSSSAAEKSRAEALLQQLNGSGELPQSYPCPIQAVRFGNDLTLVAIGGETTVEYSLRLKKEMAAKDQALWVAGYSNDVFGYLGSRKVILEGGYEGYSSNFGRHPGPWAVDTEERVIRKVYEVLQSLNH
jgi:neutral ceramidase